MSGCLVRDVWRPRRWCWGLGTRAAAWETGSNMRPKPQEKDPSAGGRYRGPSRADRRSWDRCTQVVSQRPRPLVPPRGSGCQRSGLGTSLSGAVGSLTGSHCAPWHSIPAAGATLDREAQGEISETQARLSSMGCSPPCIHTPLSPDREASLLRWHAAVRVAIETGISMDTDGNAEPVTCSSRGHFSFQDPRRGPALPCRPPLPVPGLRAAAHRRGIGCR